MPAAPSSARRIARPSRSRERDTPATTGRCATRTTPRIIPGGSSSGSAVVLATGQADVAIGGDQGGSIRLPASWSGVLGLKPTFGLVPYTGCAMIEATLDHIGPMATTADGIARLLSAIAGQIRSIRGSAAPFPAISITDYMPALRRGVNGLKVALIKEGFAQSGEDTGLPPSDPEVDRCVAAAARKLATLGATVEEISLPMHLDAFHIWNGVVTEGAADFVMRGAGLGTNWQGFYNTALAQALARGMKARPNDLPAPAKLVLLTGEYMRREYPGRYYGKAQNLRPLATAAYDAALARYDLLAMPTIPFTATRMVGPRCVDRRQCRHRAEHDPQRLRGEPDRPSRDQHSLRHACAACRSD